MSIVQPTRLTVETVSIEEFDLLDASLPDEFTAELINGRVIVSPAPVGDHHENIASIARQIGDALRDHWLYQEAGIEVGSYRDGRVRPDGVVAPLRYFRGQPVWADPSGVLAVLEVTSGRDASAEIDRIEKRNAYAATGIGVYLLVDRLRREVTVYWDPSGGRYTHQSSVVFGERLSLPAPLDFALDTSELA